VPYPVIVRETGSPDEGNPDGERGGLISGAVQKENAVGDEGVEYPNCSSEGTQRPPSHSFACCCASSSGEDPRKQRHGRLDEIAIRRALVR